MNKRLPGFLASLAFMAGAYTGAVAQPYPTAPPIAKKLTVTYHCSGLKVVAHYDNVRDRVAFVYGAKHFVLKRAVSADGVRYVGSGLEWWDTGRQVTLSSVQPGSTRSSILAHCLANINS